MHYIVGLLISAHQKHITCILIHSHLIAICTCRKLKGVIEDDEDEGGEDGDMSAEQEEEEVQGRREIEKELRLWKK